MQLEVKYFHYLFVYMKSFPKIVVCIIIPQYNNTKKSIEKSAL